MTQFKDLSGNNLYGVNINENGVGDASSPNAVDVTPHATNPVSVGRALFVGVGGDVTGRLVGQTADQTFTFAGGMEHPFVFSHIRATGTTATGLKVVL